MEKARDDVRLRRSTRAIEARFARPFQSSASKVITIAAPKGGTGKSNTVAVLAARAATESHRTRGKGGVAMIDLNEDQATPSQWWTLRGRPVNPYLLKDGGTLDEDIKILGSDGWDYCVIDGPPYDMDMIEMTVVLASVVIIPIVLDEAVEGRGNALAAIRLLVDQYIRDTTFEHLDHGACDGPVAGVSVVDHGPVGVQGRARDGVGGAESNPNLVHRHAYHALSLVNSITL